jgi:hypothetical protein
MKALVRDRYGWPDVLELRDVETPTPKRLRYPHDEHLATGPVHRNVGIQLCALSPEYTDAPELGVADRGIRV